MLMRRSGFVVLTVLLVAASISPVLAVKPGDSAPTLALPQLGHDEDVHLSDFVGKVVYVDFWASWCAPCRRSLPLYDAMVQRLPQDRFQLLAINLDENIVDAQDFLNRHPVSYPVLLDPQGASAETWTVAVMPSSYLVDANGTVTNIYLGFEPNHAGKIEDDIKTLLALMPGNRVGDTVGLR